MAVTNKMLMDELQRLQSRVDELGAAIALLCERAVGLETWRNGHEKNAHAHLQKQIEAAQRLQERHGERLWRMGLQVANLAALLMAIAKMAGVW